MQVINLDAAIPLYMISLRCTHLNGFNLDNLPGVSV